MVKQQARQGDLLFIRVSKMPDDVKKSKDNVLALGEITGHHHKADGPGVAVFEHSTGSKFVSAPVEWSATHQEHGHIAFESGIWEVRRQQEYEPEAVHQIAD